MDAKRHHRRQSRTRRHPGRRAVAPSGHQRNQDQPRGRHTGLYRVVQSFRNRNRFIRGHLHRLDRREKTHLRRGHEVDRGRNPCGDGNRAWLRVRGRSGRGLAVQRRGQPRARRAALPTAAGRLLAWPHHGRQRAVGSFCGANAWPSEHRPVPAHGCHQRDHVQPDLARRQRRVCRVAQSRRRTGRPQQLAVQRRHHVHFPLPDHAACRRIHRRRKKS